MKTLILFCSLLTVSVSIAQGVKISGTPGTPDPSAGLDVDFANKGVLFPRITTAQRLAISNPAHGLLIYQTDAPQGFWYNAGSPSAPNWIQVVGTPVNTTIDMANNSIQNLPLPVNNSDAVNKAYVDALVASGGGGTPVGIPTMMSNESSTGYTVAGAVGYCNNLTESGHSDWRLPTFDELTYFLGSVNDSSYVWTKTKANNKENPLNQNYVSARLVDGKWTESGEVVSMYPTRTFSGSTTSTTFVTVATFSPSNPGNVFWPIHIVLTGSTYGVCRLVYYYADGSIVTTNSYSGSGTHIDDTYPLNTAITPITKIDVQVYHTYSSGSATLKINGYEISMQQNDGATRFVRCVR